MNPLPWLAPEGSALFPLLTAAGLLALSLAIGRRLLKLFGASAEGTPAERGAIAACLGAGALQFVPFALGLTGQLNVNSLRIAGLAASLLLLPDLLAVARGLIAEARICRRPDNWHIAWVIALSPAILMATIVALTPSLDPDGLAYHLTVPKRWMEAGYLIYLPTYPYSNAPMGMELLFAWAMAFGGDSAAKCVHLVLGLLAVLTIYLAGRRLSGPMVGAVPATLFLVGPAGAATILGYSYVEGGAAFATASGALAWLIWYRTGSAGFLRAAMLLAGIAVSFKVSAAFFPIALGALSFLALYERLLESKAPRPLVRALSVAVALIPFVAVPVVPWLVRAFTVTGNPFFPLLASRIPSRDLSAALATQVDDYNRYMVWGNSFGRYWNAEQRAYVLLAIGFVVLLAGLFACYRVRTRLARGTALIVTFTLLAQLSAAGLYLRYSLPLAAALMLPLAMPLAGWLARRRVMVVWIAITLVCSIAQARRSFLEAGGDLQGMVATVAGIQPRAAFLERRMSLYALHARVNRELPASAGIMLSLNCAAFYIDRKTFCAEMVQDSLRFTTWEAFNADLARLGITHVIAPTFLANGLPAPEFGGSSVSVITREAQFQVVRQLLTQHARVLQIAADQGLYEIDPAWLANHAAPGI